MDKQMTVAAPSDPFNSLRVMKDSVAALNQIYLRTNEGVLQIQSAYGTSTAFDSLLKMAPFIWHGCTECRLANQGAVPG